MGKTASTLRIGELAGLGLRYPELLQPERAPVERRRSVDMAVAYVNKSRQRSKSFVGDPIQTAATSNQRENLFISTSLQPTPEERDLLRRSFEKAVKNAECISIKVMRGLLTQLPSTIEAFHKSGRRSSLPRTDAIDLASRGMIMFRGIEKCLYFLDNIDLVQQTMSDIALSHYGKDVPIGAIPILADLFETEILLSCRTLHDRTCRLVYPKMTLDILASSSLSNFNFGLKAKSVNNLADENHFKLPKILSGRNNVAPFNDCVMCQAWQRFFDLLNIVIISEMMMRCN